RTRVGPGNDHATVVPPRAGVSPGHLVGDPVAGGPQADVVDPAEQVEVFGSQRPARHRSPFNQRGGRLKDFHLPVAGREDASRLGADAVRRGAWAGLVAGFAVVAAMYVAALLTGGRRVPGLPAQPI